MHIILPRQAARPYKPTRDSTSNRRVSQSEHVSCQESARFRSACPPRRDEMDIHMFPAYVDGDAPASTSLIALILTTRRRHRKARMNVKPPSSPSVSSSRDTKAQETWLSHLRIPRNSDCRSERNFSAEATPPPCQAPSEEGECSLWASPTRVRNPSSFTTPFGYQLCNKTHRGNPYRERYKYGE